MKLKLSLFISLISVAITKAQYIQVDETYTAQQLVVNGLLNSPCIPVSNFSVSGGFFSDNSKSYAYFTNSSPSFPFTNGIILSTGKASSALGPNVSMIKSDGSSAWPGDPDLEEALGISDTYNNTVLEFDFIPQSNRISFDYIFASEEYTNTLQCNYSDGFAFLIKKVGSADPYENLAVIPGTTDPVRVTSVHPLVGGSNGCPAINEEFFGSYNPYNYPISFNGQTKVLTAETDVDQGELYHIKLVIADHQDYEYDSAIFLKGGSFGVGPDFGPSRLLATGNPLCPGETLVLDATQSGTVTYQWYKNNAILPGETNPTYTVSSAGDYKVTVTLNSACSSVGEISVEYSTITVSNTTLYQCDYDGNGLVTYNLSYATNAITGGDNTLSVLGYFLNQTDAENGLNPIPNPQAYQNAPSQNTVVAKIKNQYNCIGYATITLQIGTSALLNSIAPFESCDQDTNQNGITTLDLNLVNQSILLANPSLPNTSTVQYFNSAQDAENLNNPLPLAYTNTTAFQQIIYARIVNGSNCYNIIPITLIINTFSPSNFNDENAVFCDGNSVVLNPGSGFFSYSWNTTPTQNSQTLTVAQAGTYLVTVTNNKGCKAVKKYTVISSGSPVTINIIETSFQGTQNSITVYPQGTDLYEYSLDNINYQGSNYFTNLAPGKYTVYVRDIYKCRITPKDVYILDYPKFFTPNADGHNDYWRIENLEINYPNAKLTVFDRFGKLLKELGTDGDWDGIFEGIAQPATDYWFVLELKNGTIIKGHFSLKR